MIKVAIQILVILVFGLLFCFSKPNIAGEQQHDFSAYALLRYENDARLVGQPSRERMRLIARASLLSEWSPKWQTKLTVGTGLRNKQNVPAITVYRFTEQNQPDTDIFINQAYVQYSAEDFQIRAGKQPWDFFNITDTFWDRDLNPIGISLRYKPENAHTFNFASLLPLDGENDTVGQLYVGQYHLEQKQGSLGLAFAPWFAYYNGQNSARFATRDTQFDHRSVRLSTALKYQKWQFGMDLGLALNTPDEDKDQNFSIATELRYGSLKEPKSSLWQVSYSHVELFAVIREFGQNARSGLLTTNYNGWDFRYRYRLNKKLWIGTRFSRMNSLEGQTVSSNRFRIEGRWSF
ncbi:MAG: hypothetical protein Salg2KO_22000 [Salibacteraceae bacterium]